MTKYENQALHDEVFVMEGCFFLNCVLKECDIFYFGGDVEWTNLQFPELPLALPRSRPEDHTVGEKPWDDERNSDSTTMPGEYVEDELALASTTDAAQNSKSIKRPIVRTPNYRVLCSSPRKAIFALRRQRNLSTRGRSERFRRADVRLDAIKCDS